MLERADDPRTQRKSQAAFRFSNLDLGTGKICRTRATSVQSSRFLKLGAQFDF
jgi:hypothetical protein